VQDDPDKGLMSLKDGRPPWFTPILFLKRLWKSRALLPRYRRWLYFYGFPLLGIWILLFVVTALEARERGSSASGAQLAVEVAVTTTDPFGVNTWAAVALAIFSVFLVPVVIGATVGLIVEEQMRRMRIPQEEMLTELQHRVAELQQAALEREPEAETEPERKTAEESDDSAPG
jgi:hypothetical protein